MSAMAASTLLDLLRARAAGERRLHGYAFLGDGEHETARLSFQELEAAAASLGARLARVADPRSNVLLAYPPGLDFIVAFFGCLFAGLVPVPVCPPHPRRGHERLAAIAADCAARHLLTNAAGERLVAAACANGAALGALEVIATDTTFAAPAPDSGLAQAARDDLVFLQYTSGSTRAPRGVRITHRNVLANLAAICAAEGNHEQSRGLSWLPCYHDMGLVEGILQPLYGGYPSWLMPHTAFLQRPARWLEAVSRLRTTVSGGPNFAYETCVRRIGDDEIARLDLSSWEVAYGGSEPVRADTLRGFARRFAGCGFRRQALRPVYGLAEATLLVTASAPGADELRTVQADRQGLEDGRFVASPSNDSRSSVLVSCGKPAAGTEIVIVDPDSRSHLPQGRIGEIWVRGPSVSAGYYSEQGSGREAFVDVIIGGRTARWLNTGDLGFLLEDELFITGRSKDLIVLHGRKLHPQDIEHTVERLDGLELEGIAAFALENEGSAGIGLVAELNRRQIRTAVADACKRYADAILAALYREHEIALAALAFVPAGALARTSSGKLMRFRCRHDFVHARLPLLARFDAPRARAEAL